MEDDDDDNHLSMCSICERELDGMECMLKFIYPCGSHHQFHDICLISWDQYFCPICGDTYIQEEDKPPSRSLIAKAFKLRETKDYLDYLKLIHFLERRRSFQVAPTPFKKWVLKQLDDRYRHVTRFPSTVEKLYLYTKYWDDASVARLLVSSTSTLMKTYLKNFQSRFFSIWGEERIKIRNDNDDMLCAICQGPLDGMHCMLKFHYPCGPRHQFHDVCLVGWARKHPFCPICQKSFKKQPMFEFWVRRTSQYLDYLTLKKFLEERTSFLQSTAQRFKKWVHQTLDYEYRKVKHYPQTVAHLDRYLKTWTVTKAAIILARYCQNDAPRMRDLVEFVGDNHTCWENCRARNCFFQAVPETAAFIRNNEKAGRHCITEM